MADFTLKENSFDSTKAERPRYCCCELWVNSMWPLANIRAELKNTQWLKFQFHGRLFAITKPTVPSSDFNSFSVFRLRETFIGRLSLSQCSEKFSLWRVKIFTRLNPRKTKNIIKEKFPYLILIHPSSFVEIPSPPSSPWSSYPRYWEIHISVDFSFTPVYVCVLKSFHEISSHLSHFWTQFLILSNLITYIHYTFTNLAFFH